MKTTLIFPHEVAHIEAEKHGGTTTEDNLCLSCFHCNRYKGSDIASRDPETGELVALYHPRRDVWLEHFRLEKGGHIEPLTPQGRATVRLLQFNTPVRIEQRERLMRLNRYPRKETR